MLGFGVDKKARLISFLQRYALLQRVCENIFLVFDVQSPSHLALA
jgi:hypothetical protein